MKPTHARPEPEYYLIGDAAAVASLSPSTICRAVRDGELTLYRPRGRPLIKREDLHAWIERSSGKPFLRDLSTVRAVRRLQSPA